MGDETINGDDDAATQPSEQGVALIRRFEGFSPTPYLCPAGRRTIGYGHVILPGEDLPETLTQEQAQALLLADAQTAANAVLHNVSVALTQNRLDALTSFAFNVGAAAFARSTLCEVVNRGWHDEVPAQLLRWVYVNGKPSAGLMARRQAEGAMYRGQA